MTHHSSNLKFLLEMIQVVELHDPRWIPYVTKLAGFVFKGIEENSVA